MLPNSPAGRTGELKVTYATWISIRSNTRVSTSEKTRKSFCIPFESRTLNLKFRGYLDEVATLTRIVIVIHRDDGDREEFFSFFFSLRNSIVHFWKIFTKLMIIDSSNSRKRKVERISDRMNFCYQFSSRANKTFSINLIMKTETGRAINPSFLAVLYKISIISLFILFDIFFINNNCAKRRKRNYD